MELKNIPETTEDKPYIEFTFDKDGKLTLNAASDWWGGINSGFVSTGGREGNTCKPQHLEKYISTFLKRKIKNINEEIMNLEKQKEKYIHIIKNVS